MNESFVISLATAWMDKEMITLNEISHTEQDKSI